MAADYCIKAKINIYGDGEVKVTYANSSGAEKTRYFTHDDWNVQFNLYTLDGDNSYYPPRQYIYFRFIPTEGSGYVFDYAKDKKGHEVSSSSYDALVTEDGTDVIRVYFTYDPDATHYYACYDKTNGQYISGYEKVSYSGETSTPPSIPGYDILGGYYSWDFNSAVNSVVNDGETYDTTGYTSLTCNNNNAYTVYFYEKKSGWYCNSIQDFGTLSDDIDYYPKGGYGGFYTEPLQIQGLSITPNYNGYLSINVDSPPADFQTWLSKGLNLSTRGEAINPAAMTAKEAVDTTYLSYYTIASETNSILGCRVEANSKILGYAAFQNRGNSGYLNINLHYLKDKTLFYYANDGTSKAATVNLQMDSDQGVTSLYLGTNTYFTRNGYTLTGWNTAADGSGTPYSCGQTLTNITSDLTLYAQWKLNKYTVRFCNNGGTILSTLTCDPGSSITMAAATTAPAVNVEQLGWSTTNSTNYRNYNASLNSGEYRCGVTYTPTASLTIFYPIWKYRTQYIIYKDGFNESAANNQNMGVLTTFKITKSLTSRDISPTENEKFPFTKVVGNRTKNIRYRFTGWSLNENDKKPVYQAGDDITLPNSTNLYDEKIYLYSVRQPYFYFQDTKGNNLIDAYNGPIKDFITTSQMEELRGYLNDYVGNIENFTSMLPNSKIKLSDYNLLGSKVENTKFTAKDFYELQQAFNSSREDKLEPWYLQPLTFTPVNASDTITITIKKIGDFTSSAVGTLYYTKLSNERNYTTESRFPVKSFTLTNKISLSIAAVTVFSIGKPEFSIDSSNYYQFEITGGPVIITGSILSLIDQDPNFQLPDYCFYNLFKDCANIITAPELPSLKVGVGSYQGMFQGCTGLTIPPSLPATTLGNNCYSNMFQGCTSLKLAPNLPATTLNSNCYVSMFNGCTSLKIAPKLSATTLENNSYLYMFFNCSSLEDAPFIGATTLNGTNEFGAMFNHCTNLKHIKLAYTDNFSDSHFTGWVNDIAPNGILEYDGEDTTRGVDAIPSGWTVKKST